MATDMNHLRVEDAMLPRPTALDTLNETSAASDRITAVQRTLGQVIHRELSPIVGIRYIPSVHAVAVAHSDTITIIEARHLHECARLALPCTVTAVDASDSVITVGLSDGSITIIDVPTLTVRSTNKCLAHTIIAIAVNGSAIHTIDSGGVYACHNVKNFQQEHRYEEPVGALTCMLVEKSGATVWLGLTTGEIKRLSLASHAVTHVQRPAPTRYSPIRTLSSSPSPQPVKKAKKLKKGESEPEPAGTDDPTIVLWASYGCGDLIGYDTRNDAMTVVCEQQHLSYEIMSTVNDSLVRITNKANASSGLMSPSNALAALSVRSSPFVQMPTNESSLTITHAILYNDDRLILGQSDGLIAVMNAKLEAGVKLVRQSIIEIDAQGCEEMEWMTLVASHPANTETVTEAGGESATTEPADTNSDDDNDAGTDKEAPSEPPSRPLTAPTVTTDDTLAPVPYILAATRAGHVHILPLSLIESEVAVRLTELESLENAAFEQWCSAKSAKQSKGKTGGGGEKDRKAAKAKGKKAKDEAEG